MGNLYCHFNKSTGSPKLHPGPIWVLPVSRRCVHTPEEIVAQQKWPFSRRAHRLPVEGTFHTMEGAAK
ncbi:hypothetical protein BaRGS_00033768, partial [Batillaria attramentaria]